ncbi:MAG: glutamate synthase [NADPH] small chain [Actinomycetes bacterium]|nr:MAG: glutamate synthase [NADPH] small chain [Actinomycetes bacterium]
MANPRGFLEVRRAPAPERPPQERVRDYAEIYGTLPEDELRHQASRCMDCGVPFCNNACPLGNLIPDWNDLARVGDWRRAIDQLHATNNFPEFTGLICPAPCESACVLDIDDDPVMIKQIEYWTINHAFEQGWVVPEPPETRTGRHVAVVGSGPAGMAAAAELNKVGHRVTVYERDEAPGGMMRFGVPDAKLEKWMIDRRIAILEQEGIEFRYNVEVGRDLPVERLRADHDAVVLAIGSRVERDLEMPGRDLDGVHLAMPYLYARNRWVAESQGRPAKHAPREISAAGRRVVVIGGGDTGMDCVSNALREGAEDVLLLDVYPEVPASGRYPNTPWPVQPRRLVTTYALEEGGERRFGRQVLGLEGTGGRVSHVVAREVTGESSRSLTPIEGSEFAIEADLVLIAVGFTGPEHAGLLDDLGIAYDRRGNVRAGSYATSVDGVFAAGDARVGASLIVTAIAEGRRCARVVEAALR